MSAKMQSPPESATPGSKVPALVVLVHGAGPKLSGFIENAQGLASSLGPATTLRQYDAASSIRMIEQAMRSLGDHPFGYDPKDLARVTYDWRTAERIAADAERTLEEHGRHGVLIVIGHSMGAAAAVHAVELLASRGYGVDDLVLLDQMFFEWKVSAFFGMVDRRVRLTERGARRIGVLHEVLVQPKNLTTRERIWVSAPSGGHRSLPRDLDRFPGEVIRETAPEDYGHAALVWWADPFRRIARRWGNAWTCRPINATLDS